jgi:hypothetical protein
VWSILFTRRYIFEILFVRLHSVQVLLVYWHCSILIIMSDHECTPLFVLEFNFTSSASIVTYRPVEGSVSLTYVRIDRNVMLNLICVSLKVFCLHTYWSVLNIKWSVWIISFIALQQITVKRIETWGFLGRPYSLYSLLGYNTASKWYKLPMFRRNILLPSSGSTLNKLACFPETSEVFTILTCRETQWILQSVGINFTRFLLHRHLAVILHLKFFSRYKLWVQYLCSLC